MNVNHCIFYNSVIRSIIFKNIIVKCYIYNYYSIFSCSYTKSNLVWKTRRNPEDDLTKKKGEKRARGGADEAYNFLARLEEIGGGGGVKQFRTSDLSIS